MDFRGLMEMSPEEIDELLGSHGVGVLSLARGSVPYSFPIAYGFSSESGIICFQFANSPEGRKARYVAEETPASFVVFELEQNQDARSVIIEGSLRPVREEEEEAVYGALAETAIFSVFHVSGFSIEETDFVLYRLEPDSITGRKFEWGDYDGVEERR